MHLVPSFHFARGISRVVFNSHALGVLLAASLPATDGLAATPPASTLVYSTSASGGGKIRGGIATIGTSGVTYFTVTSANSTKANITALNANGIVKWKTEAPQPGSAYDMYAIPTLDAAGLKLYIGSEAGTFYCLNTSDGSMAWSYPVTTGTDRRIRSGAALDPNSPLGPTVYFHCNNGRLYALNATTGAWRWDAATGNDGGPPTAFDPAFGIDWDPSPVSSSPVVDPYGTVYVGSRDGYVYSFNPSTGAQNWRTAVNAVSEPIEATLAIGQNGVLYGATRENPSGTGAHVFALNPASHAVIWRKRNDGVANQGPGYVASPVIDQSGFIYGSHFGHTVTKFSPVDGSVLQIWSFQGKLCQTPTINQNGLLILGESAFNSGEVNRISAIRIGDSTSPTANSPYWSITAAPGQSLGMFAGACAIRCTAAGTAYFGDELGQVWRFDSGAPMMAGDWPTFQCGNRRAGKSATYPTVIAELPAFYFNDVADVRSVDIFGRAVGQAHGYYDSPCYLDTGYGAALWRNNSISAPGGCAMGIYLVNTYATGINGSGDVIGYNPAGPIVWPDGANSSTFYVGLTTPGYTGGYASHINASGTIVGYAYSGSTVHVFRWTKSSGTWNGGQDLAAPAGGQAYAFGVSDSGRIVGKAKFTSSGPFHALVTTPQTPPVNDPSFDIGTLGGTSSEAWDINDSSGSVGWAQNASGYRRAFYRLVSQQSSLQSGNALPALPGVTRTDFASEAYGVNAYGEAVGYAQNQSLASRAFKYMPGGTGTMVDLNTFLPGGSLWVLTRAIAINDAGAIVGTGTYNGTAKSWILYPQSQD